MFTFVYISAARHLLNEHELSELLAVSARNNAAKDITGMLLYADGNFMQALEGEEDAINALAEKIALDPRHTRMMTLHRGPIAERRFANWSMALRRLNDLPPEDRESCKSFLTVTLGNPTGTSTDIVLSLLNNFRTTMG